MSWVFWGPTTLTLQLHSVLKYNKNVQIKETGWNVSIVKLARSLYFRIIHLYPLAGLFEYLFMLWLHRHLPAKQALNSKQSAKGFEGIIQDILRRSGYFNIKFFKLST